MKYAPSLTKTETIQGFAWMGFELIFLPGLLGIVTYFIPMDLLEANLVYYAINLAAVVIIFRHFLLSNFDVALDNPGNTLMAVLFGMGRYLIMSMLVGTIIVSADPDFVNFNDETLVDMAGANLSLLAFGTIVLVPPAEEALFRGLIFRNLMEKNKAAAYLVSALAFAAVHMVSFLPEYTPMELFLTVLQYLPAGLCLGWAYERSGSIFAPILIHCLVNAMGIAGMR